MISSTHKKCEKCGATEVAFDIVKQHFICQFCRFSYSVEAKTDDGLVAFNATAIADLIGVNQRGGSLNINETAEDVITMKCSGCGAEVVVNTTMFKNPTCHWCRNVLSINTQIPNGLIPDAVLPFQVTQEEAFEKIQKFAKSRMGYTIKEVKETLLAQNVHGIYLPYMVADVNAKYVLRGTGNKVTREYDTLIGNNVRNFTTYKIERDLHFTVDDLILESSAARSNIENTRNSNQIINALLPYDVANAVSYDSRFLNDFVSEKRDLNIAEVGENSEEIIRQLGKNESMATVSEYDHGVKWKREELKIKGIRWNATYLPVWMYSYQGKDARNYYIAVNGRTGKVMGSMPISKKRVLGKFLIYETIMAAIFGAIWMATTPSTVMSYGLFGMMSLLMLVYYPFKTFQADTRRLSNRDVKHDYLRETKVETVRTNGKDRKLWWFAHQYHARKRGANWDNVQKRAKNYHRIGDYS